MKTELAIAASIRSGACSLIFDNGKFFRSGARAEHFSDRGYLYVGVTVDGKWMQARAGRLTWILINGEIPAGMEVNHENGNKSDNTPDNLNLKTRSGNMLHAYRTGLKSNRGEKHPSSKLTEQQVKEIRHRRASGEFLKSIAASYGVTHQAIVNIVKGRNWSHV